MKLRIKGSSLRLRVSRSEMVRLMDDRRIEETIYFAAGEDSKLTYALEHSTLFAELSVRYDAQEVTVVVPTGVARRWAEGDDVGIYGESDNGHGRLTLLVEKDFACLDRDDADNEDTFPHPKAGTVC